MLLVVVYLCSYFSFLALNMDIERLGILTVGSRNGVEASSLRGNGMKLQNPSSPCSSFPLAFSFLFFLFPSVFCIFFLLSEILVCLVLCRE